MKHRPKARPDDVRTAQNPQADAADRAAALSRLAADRRLDQRATIEAALHAPEPLLRATAVGLLVGQWRIAALVPRAVELMESDPAWDVRAGAAMAIGAYARRLADTDAGRGCHVRALVAALQRESDPSVQVTIYEEVLRLIGGDDAWLDLPVDFDRERDVDWLALSEFV